jgi:LmeA-like phospholipid-binding
MWRGGAGAWNQASRRFAFATLAVVVVVLVAAQIALPRIAASRISSRVGRYGKVLSVSVSAWPAIELLWGHAGSAHVRAGSLALSPGRASALLWEARGVSHIEVTAQHVRLGSLALEGARLQKRGSSLQASARVSGAAVRAALPSGISVSLLGSGGGQVTVAASGSLFGIGATVRAVAQASGGKLVAHPLGLLLEGFQLTLFADPHVAIDGVGASMLSSNPLEYGLTIGATLH